MRAGRFITLEGGEGVGKSTNLGFIKDYLETRGKPVITTREPGGTALGEHLRALLLASDTGVISADAELLILFAARAQHLETVIVPALSAGQWVVCDRFTDASYAYQGSGRGIPEPRIQMLEQWVQQGLTPDLTLLLDAPLAVGLARVQRRGKLDRFETEERLFFQRVRAGYQHRAASDPRRIKLIDANRPLDLVQAAIAPHLERLLADDDCL